MTTGSSQRLWLVYCRNVEVIPLVNKRIPYANIRVGMMGLYSMLYVYMPCLNSFLFRPHKTRSWLTKAHWKLRHVFYWVSIGITLHHWSNILAWIESSKKQPIRKQQPLELIHNRMERQQDTDSAYVCCTYFSCNLWHLIPGHACNLRPPP